MPFGLNNAPAVFQEYVNDVLRDMLNKFLPVGKQGGTCSPCFPPLLLSAVSSLFPPCFPPGLAVA